MSAQLTCLTDRRAPFGGLLAAALLAVASPGQAQKETVLVPQQGSAWCWAASSQMVMEAVGPSADYSQAKQAELVVPGCVSAPRDTCGNANSVFAGCNRPGFPTFKEYKFTFQDKPSPLGWKALKDELDNGRPVLFGWCVEKHCGNTLDDSMGHWMVAVAADVCAQGDMKGPTVKVFNPAPCCKGQVLNVSYSTYAKAIPGLKFWQNFYQVTPPGPPSIPTPTPTPLPSGAALPRAPLDLTRDTLTACLTSAGRWQASGLLRTDIPPPLAGDDIGFGSIVHRHYIPLAAVGAVRTSGVPVTTAGPSQPLTVLSVKRDNHSLANAVFEGVTPTMAPVAIEDSESARRQLARVAAAKEANPGASTLDEYVVLGTGVHFIPVPAEHRDHGHHDAEEDEDDVDVIVILSEIDCRNPAQVELPKRIALTELVELLTVSR